MRGAVLLLLCGLWAEAGAETRRALLVGINRYNAAGALPAVLPAPRVPRIALQGAARERILSDLEGPWTDITAVGDLLVARYGFRPDDVVLLGDRERAPRPDRVATAQNILDTFLSHLVQRSARGDVSFFYYAGHGSRIYNRATGEYEETLVAADALSGAPDVRDKELLRLYRAAVAKGVRLTVVFDSCHGGGMSRTLGAVARDAPPDSRSVSDRLEFPRAWPTEQGMLFVAAARDNEKAFEAKVRGAYHGLFSLAFADALAKAATNEPFANLFSRVAASLKLMGDRQEPTYTGKGRDAATLLGAPAAPRAVSAVVLRVESSGVVVLNAGLAAGVAEGSEFVRGPVHLRVAERPTLAQSRAAVTRGPAALVAPGDVFELAGRAEARREALRLYAPAGPYPARAELLAQAARLRGSAPRAVWVADPQAARAARTLRWERSGWVLEGAAGRAQPVAPGPSLAAALGSSEVFLEAPLTREMGALDLGSSATGGLVETTARRAEASYVLQGRVTRAGVEYRWSATAAASADGLPRSGCWRSGDDAAYDLARDARKLARLQFFRTLDAGAAAQPSLYDLFLEDARGRLLDGGALRAGERYSLTLRLGQSAQPGAPRYVYVLGIDPDGSIATLFPRGEGNGSSNLAAGALKPRLPVDFAFTARDLGGASSFVVLTTAERLQPAELEQTGLDVCVRGRGEFDRPLPRANWSAQKRTFLVRK